jgi:hypothetical protein
VLVVAAVGYVAWRQSVPPVRAQFASTPTHLGVATPLTLTLTAARGGVAAVELRVIQGQGHAVITRQEFSGVPVNEQRLQLTVDGPSLGLRDGRATLEIRARDGFWRPLRVDDRPVLSLPVTIDTTPPSLEVLSATRYLGQAGGGVVVVRARGASRTGVVVGERFMPAYPVGSPEAALHAGLFAIPWDLPPRASLQVQAEDDAGNRVVQPLPAEIKPRRFPTDTIELKEEFLARKLPELLPGRGAIPTGDLLPAFLTVNRDQRKQAEERKRQLATRTQGQVLWAGAFLQPRNTKVFSNFAETRTYRYRGQVVDTQVHWGYDLASVKQSPVPAANGGVVVFTGPLTIYGNTVVVDHGWGLQTLYAHLSSVAVKEGDPVSRGQELGRTGATGLAIGDHLHYEVLIHGISVTPIEWWDGRWIRDHIDQPLREANVPLLQEPRADSGVDTHAARSPRSR